MIVKHDEAAAEHRILVNLTPLEAELWLRDQSVVRREIKRRLRAALSGCEQRVAARDRTP